MYLSPDDAKTDVILAAVVAVLGVSLRAFVANLPLYPRGGLVGAVVDLVWLFALTSLVPLLLARYRGDGPAAFGLTGAGRGFAAGLVLAIPAVVLGMAVQTLATVGTGVAPLLGRLAGPLTTGSVLDLALTIVVVVLLVLGSVLLFGFLATRAAQGFPRSPDTSLTQLVRTLGTGAVVVAAVGGLLRALTGGSLVVAIVNTIALAAILLLTDRLVPPGIRVPRATVAAPVVVIVVGSVFATGGLFRGDLLTGLTVGALASGVGIAIASLSRTRYGTAAVVPLVVAVHLWPTCLSPLMILGPAQPFGTVC